MQETCYYIGAGTFKERKGKTYATHYDPINGVSHNVALRDGQTLWDVSETELFFPYRGLANEIERLTDMKDYPDGLPADFSDLYFQLLKAIWMEHKSQEVKDASSD